MGVNRYVTTLCLGAKHLAGLRKTSCALAQNENHYLCNAVTLWLNRLFGLSQKKPIGITNGLCGAYEIRTRDLLRDRQAF